MEIMNKKHNSVEKFWNDYLNVNPNNKKEIPQSFYFCDNKKDADECAELVVKGIKQATATSLWWFKKNNVSLPRVNNKYIVTDWVGNPRAIIETIKVQQVPFNKITPRICRN